MHIGMSRAWLQWSSSSWQRLRVRSALHRAVARMISFQLLLAWQAWGVLTAARLTANKLHLNVAMFTRRDISHRSPPPLQPPSPPPSPSPPPAAITTAVSTVITTAFTAFTASAIAFAIAASTIAAAALAALAAAAAAATSTATATSTAAPTGDSRFTRCLQGGGIAVLGGTVSIVNSHHYSNTATFVCADVRLPLSDCIPQTASLGMSLSKCLTRSASF